MINSNKRGQSQSSISTIFGGLLLIFVIAIGIVAYNNNWDFGSATDTVSSAFMGVMGPLFNALLGLDSAGNNAFLMVLVFIMISIIIVGTLDSFTMFGDDVRGKTMNFLIGIIVSIIGVRFMPKDLWASLTAPSSAFVATILVGLPFFALIFVSLKAKSMLARKLLWLFYLVTTAFLWFKTSGQYGWIYGIFTALAAVMLFFDSTARKFFFKEKAKSDVAKQEADIDLMGRAVVRDEIAKVKAIIDNTNTPEADLAKAKAKLTRLRKKYAEMAND